MRRFKLVVVFVPEAGTKAVVAAAHAAGGGVDVSPVPWLDGRVPTRKDLGGLASDVGDAAFEAEKDTAVQEENNEHIPKED